MLQARRRVVPLEVLQYLHQLVTIESIVTITVEFSESFVQLRDLPGRKPARRQRPETKRAVLLAQAVHPFHGIEGMFSGRPEFHRIVAKIHASAIDDQRQLKSQLRIVEKLAANGARFSPIVMIAVLKYAVAVDDPQMILEYYAEHPELLRQQRFQLAIENDALLLVSQALLVCEDQARDEKAFLRPQHLEPVMTGIDDPPRPAIAGEHRDSMPVDIARKLIEQNH